MTCRAAAAADAGPGRKTEPTPHFTAREGILSPRTTPGQPRHKHTHISKFIHHHGNRHRLQFPHKDSFDWSAKSQDAHSQNARDFTCQIKKGTNADLEHLMR